MPVLLNSLLSPAWLVPSAALVTVVAVLLVLPLRGGNGQHAGPACGASGVWALRERVLPEAESEHREHDIAIADRTLAQRRRFFLLRRPIIWPPNRHEKPLRLADLDHEIRYEKDIHWCPLLADLAA